MRIRAVPSGPIEWLGFVMNRLPRPLLETKFAYTLARTIMIATRVGVFEALAHTSARAAEVADRCGTSPAGTEKLLAALTASGYLRARRGRYRLTAASRRWLLRDSPQSLVDMMQFQFPQWEWLSKAESFVRTGVAIDMHEALTDEEWSSYQHAMRALARSVAGEACRHIPLPEAPKTMLDVGGSHGAYSAALCRLHDGLSATILDLPKAVEHAAPLLQAEGLGTRLTHRIGDARTEDLGVEAFDVVLVSQLIHHLTERENEELALKVSRALRPGGVHVVLDQFPGMTDAGADQIAALQGFFFAMTSRSGLWPQSHVAQWQSRAGLLPHPLIRLRKTAGVAIQAASKPRV